MDKISTFIRGIKCNCDIDVLESVVEIAMEIARLGPREGGAGIGTLFVMGDEEKVLQKSKPLILDPLAYHPQETKDIRDTNMQGTIKELAKLDGAFVISGTGCVLSAARHIQTSSQNIDLPMGFGSRHMAAASISKETDAVAVVVSKRDSVVRIFENGELIGEIIPWALDLRKIKPRVKGKLEKVVRNNLTVILKRQK
jgi:DNA integrity scanning protein DisA with diadenylate cyclase activity